MFKRYFIIFSTLYTLSQGVAWAESHYDMPVLTLLDEFDLEGFREPSGLCFDRGTLIVVGDEGHIARVSLKGEVLNHAWLGVFDLEGVMINRVNGLIYALDERSNNFVIVHPDSFEISGFKALPSQLTAPFEGLSIDGAGNIYLVNQRKKKKSKEAALFILTDGRIKEKKTGIVDQSAVLWTQRGIFILSDSLNRLYKLSPQGKILWHCQLPGENQEGLAVDEEGFFYIAQDSGGMLKMELHE